MPITMHTPGCPCCDGSSSSEGPIVDCQSCGLPASDLSASVRYRIALCSGPPFVIDPCECYGGTHFPLDATISATLRFVDKRLYLDAPGGKTLRSPYHWVSGPHCIPATIEGLACGCPGVMYAEAEAYFVLSCEDVAGRFYVARRWKKDANLWPTCDSVTPAYVEESDRATMNMIGGGAGVGQDTPTYRSFTLAGSCSPLALSASYTAPACSSSPIRDTTQQEDVNVTL